MNTFEAEAGESIWTACKRVQSQIRGCGDLTFNGITLTVTWDSNIDDLATIYNLKCRLRQLEGI